MASKAKKKRPGKISSFEEAREALRQYRTLNAEIKLRMEEHGITKLQDQAADLKKAATNWAVETETDRIDLGSGVYARLRQDKYGGTWVATTDDLEGAPSTAIPLFEILKLKFKRKPQTLEHVWTLVTKRSVDPDALQKAINDGTLTTAEIAPAFYEKEKAPFIIIYGD
jgi:hypothetical protein